MERKDAYDLIEQPRAMRILITLTEIPEDSPVSEILDQVGGSKSTGINRLDEFRKAGLVEKRAGNNRTIYSLTEKGQKVAHHLEIAINTIQGGKNDGE